MQKDFIRKSMIIKNEKREKSRLIESSDTRIVHFIFDPKQPTVETGFSKKFNKLMAEELEEFEKEEEEAFNSYVEQIAQAEDDADLEDPIKYEDNKFYELELKDLYRLSFAVADNPFMKVDAAKFYPEITIINGNGEVVA